MTTTTPKQPKATSKGGNHTTTTPAGSPDRELTRPGLGALLARIKTPDGKPKYGMIREGWNLKSDQLSKGLARLGSQGAIQLLHQKRGRHARLILKPGADPDSNMRR